MRVLFSLVIIVHGLIRLMGFVKAFHYAELCRLTKATLVHARANLQRCWRPQGYALRQNCVADA
jgi:hypothetical protein